jgi:hypothetical protein
MILLSGDVVTDCVLHKRGKIEFYIREKITIVNQSEDKKRQSHLALPFLHVTKIMVLEPVEPGLLLNLSSDSCQSRTYRYPYFCFMEFASGELRKFTNFFTASLSFASFSTQAACTMGGASATSK